MHPDKRRDDYMTKAELGRLVRGRPALEAAVLACATYFKWGTRKAREEAVVAIKKVTKWRRTKLSPMEIQLEEDHMPLDKHEEEMLKLLLKKKGKALAATLKPQFVLDKSSIRRVEATLSDTKRVVLVRGMKGNVTIYALETYLSKKEFGETRGALTLAEHMKGKPKEGADTGGSDGR